MRLAVVAGVLLLLFACGCEHDYEELTGGNPSEDSGTDSAPPLEDSGSSEIPSPVIDGEPSAGHPNPAWLWQDISEATSYEARCEACGERDWTTTGTETIWRASGLTEGDYTVEVRACVEESCPAGSCSVCSIPGSFTTTVEYFVPHEGYDGHWNGVRRALTRTPTGHVTAIVAQDAYAHEFATATENGTGTLAAIDQALGAGADVIELDVKLVGGTLYIDEEDDAATERALLTEALSHDALVTADQPLYLEISSTSDFDAVADAILQTLDANRAFASNGRPIFVRSSATDEAALRAVISARDSFPLISAYIRTHSIVGAGLSSLDDYLDRLDAVNTASIDGVSMLHDEASLLTKVSYARSLGLGVDLGTLTWRSQHIALREVVDALTSDQPLAEVRMQVDGYAPFVFFDASEQVLTDRTLDYFRDPRWVTVPILTAPGPLIFTYDRGDVLFGSTLTYVGRDSHRLPLGDDDLPAGAGAIVSAYVVFNDLTLSEGTAQAIVSKAESGGYALDLDRKTGQVAYLRYYAWVEGEYRIAQVPVSTLVERRAYLITGSFDGEGRIRLFVDNRSVATGPRVFAGGIRNTDVPITVGANPAPGDVFFHHFSGNIQMVTVAPFFE